jgi:putative peptidoglycan lipid II flippase
MSTELARGSVRQYTNLLVKSLRLILFVMLPATAFGIVLRRQIITLLFDYGRFDAYAVDLTADALFFFLLGLASESLIVILARAFYAGRDTLTPVVAAIVAVVVNVSVGVATVGTLGLPGLALGLAIGSWIETGILVVILWRRVPGFGVGSLADAALRSGLCALAAGLTALGVSRGVEAALGFDLGKPAIAAQVLVAGAMGALVFLGLARLLRIPELPTILGLMRDALRRQAT